MILLAHGAVHIDTVENDAQQAWYLQYPHLDVDLIFIDGLRQKRTIPRAIGHYSPLLTIDQNNIIGSLLSQHDLYVDIHDGAGPVNIRTLSSKQQLENLHWIASQNYEVLADLGIFDGDTEIDLDAVLLIQKLCGIRSDFGLLEPGHAATAPMTFQMEIPTRFLKNGIPIANSIKMVDITVDMRQFWFNVKQAGFPATSTVTGNLLPRGWQRYLNTADLPRFENLQHLLRLKCFEANDYLL